MKYIPALLYFFLCLNAVRAQDASLQRRDSLRQKLEKDSARIFRKTLAKPYCRAENRNSFITKERVNLLGFMVGATFVEKHTFCVGYYFLGIDPKTIRKFTVDFRSKEILDLHYFNVSYVHVLLNKRFVQVNIPLEAGYGTYKLELKDNLNNPLGTTHGNFVPFNGGVQFIFKPIKWAGLSTTGGYRYVQQGDLEVSLRGWYYSIGIWLDARHLIRTGRYYLVKRKYTRQL